MEELFPIIIFTLAGLGATFLVLIPVFWFLIVPKVARRLTWSRFGKNILALIFDDQGRVELKVSRNTIPEGIIETAKDEWRMLPRPKIKSKMTEQDIKAQKILLSKYYLQDHGKPLFVGYAGKAPLFSPLAIAALDSNPGVKALDADELVADLKSFANEVSEMYKKPLLERIENLKAKLAFKPIQYLDVATAIKENIPQLYTPTQLLALARNRYERGLRTAGKQWTPLIIGGAVLAVILILGIIALVYFLGGKSG